MDHSIPHPWRHMLRRVVLRLVSVEEETDNPVKMDALEKRNAGGNEVGVGGSVEG